MRILLDYRPALRERTGVGEYVHESRWRSRRRLGAGDTLTLFSSSWKDRLGPGAIAGARIVDVALPVRLLNAAGTGWTGRRSNGSRAPLDIVHSMHPLLMPATGARRRS